MTVRVNKAKKMAIFIFNCIFEMNSLLVANSSYLNFYDIFLLTPTQKKKNILRSVN